MRKLNILFVASEVVPFAKSGGLADVAGALPKALAKLGHDVRVVMPRYYKIDRSKLKHLKGPLGVPMGPMGERWCGVYESKLPKSKVPIYFIDYEEFFGRGGLYDENGVPYSDNDNRFIFLSKASLQLCKKIGFKPDIIHANDWHTASIPALVKSRFKSDFKDVTTMLTIHNLEHQGVFFKGAIDVMEIGWERFNPLEFESMDTLNMLKGGIANADVVTTVSKKYAKEIQTSDFGFGLEEHIKAHNHKLYGILNGIDYDEWNPKKDKYIAKKYDENNLSGKKACKSDLQKTFNLPQREDVALIGFVGRFAKQKGIELIASCIEGLLNADIQVVMLGTGEKWAEGFFSHISAKYPQKFAVWVGYSDELAHKIEAGSDMFLMPSLFEPCGLNQIYSLKYGTLPIVRATGGLDDTIENFDEESGSGNGFKFELSTPEALYNTTMWAVNTYYNKKEQFKKMQIRAMREHFSWEDSAKDYEKLYHYTKLSKEVKKLK